MTQLMTFLQVENIEYVDNEPCVAMLSKRPGGVFAMIEEEINTPGGSETNWLAKLYQVHGASTAYLARAPPKVAQNHFVLKHYAGDVLYRTDGLLDKSQVCSRLWSIRTQRSSRGPALAKQWDENSADFDRVWR